MHLIPMDPGLPVEKLAPHRAEVNRDRPVKSPHDTTPDPQERDQILEKAGLSSEVQAWDQLERAGFDLRQANRPGQLHASVEPFQGEAQVALEHRRRSREEQGGGKTRVVARSRLELQGTLDI